MGLPQIKLICEPAALPLHATTEIQMAQVPKYRFLPWTRRGMASEVQQADTGNALPARAALPVAITISNIAPVGVNLNLYGPGDVLGIDPRLIVRIEPRPFVADFEPNYLAAIEFDLPDFPWMFTPARADAQNHLRPWLVLVVLDKAVVAPPRVNRGAPLPTITVPAAVSAQELPDLGESWAWAHTQVMSEASQPQALEAEMTAAPHLNVSRLLCPRRLAPNRQYMACLVPAFDLGVQRGLGLTPQGDIARPAWDLAASIDVKLPIYFHWEFSTGPVGDFEELARRLTPIKMQGNVGRQPMYIGEAGEGLPHKLPNDPAAYTMMEGALRAPKASNSTLADIPTDVQAGLQAAVNAPTAVATTTGTNPSTGTLAPPIYGQWQVNKHKLEPATLPWLRQLNLDPRMRSAAGLGAEVVRANQESFMQTAWEQVGDVIKANERLNWGRLALDMARRVYARHYTTLAPERLMQVTQSLFAKATLNDGTVTTTVSAAIQKTSLPDASFDPALRRLTSPQRPWMKAVARRGNFAQPGSRAAKVSLSGAILTRKVAADPADFVPDGLAGAALLDGLTPTANTTVDLTPLGIQAQLSSDGLSRMKTVRGQLVNLQPHTAPTLQIRSNIATGGLITDTHLSKLRDLQADVLAAGQDAGRVNMAVLASALVTRASGTANIAALMVNAEADAPASVGWLQVERDSELVWRTRKTDLGITVAKLGTGLKGSNLPALQAVLSRMQLGALSTKTEAGVPEITLENGDPIVRKRPFIRRDRPARPAKTLTTTLRPPIVDVEPVRRFDDAFTEMSKMLGLSLPAPVASFASFDVAVARQAVITQIRPDTTIPPRMRGLLGVAGHTGWSDVAGLMTLPTFDRIMAAPEIEGPMYEYLVKYDRDRFLPGIGQIPTDSITLLETNPRFIAAFMVGLNHEMNRELLWREYPTDQRGTIMRYFWDWADDLPDLQSRIHQWTFGAAAGDLGNPTQLRGSAAGGQIVLLLRGQLIRRYPNLQIYAWRSVNGLLKPAPGPNDIAAPVFAGQFDPDVSFAGFALTDAQLAEGDGWFFVLQEQPSEPRFGLDEPNPNQPQPARPTHWLNATWLQAGTSNGFYIKLAGNPLLGHAIPALPTPNGTRFGENAAHQAGIFLQRPMRAAIHSKQMLS